ncbi:hypothetical protein Pint_19435 [Pistacia integerrima]|uniref:Uncharacterized protein n=1 Tax=Pistacia integerrima TaxID=434235 RepID=A0ACC0YYI7_9ROSI|nr:hypothetical protein Pint_19435 [Pistacia integerrima]
MGSFLLPTLLENYVMLQRHIQMMKLLRYHYFLGKFCDGNIVYLQPRSL